MITTVTLNPAIDRTIVVEKFAFGSVNRIASVREDMGGKGINVARILQALGSPVRAVGFIGQDNLETSQTLLRRDNLAADFVRIPAATRVNTKLIEARSQTTTDLNEAGFNVSSAALSALGDKVRACASQSEFMVFSGSIPQGAPADIYQRLISLCGATCRTVLDAEGDFLLAGLQAHPFLIKPNIHELAGALGRTLATVPAVVDAARDLIRAYQVGMVLVSMGGEGSILITAEQALLADSLKVEVRGTVGAGDSMLAGFVHGLSTHQTLRQALALATVCGGLAVSKVGTESFTRSEVLELINQVHIPVLTD
jgi:1-phosphofructokinase